MEFPDWAPAELVERAKGDYPDSEIARRLLLGDAGLRHAWRWLRRNSDHLYIERDLVHCAMAALERARQANQPETVHGIDWHREVIDAAARLRQLLEGSALDDAPGVDGQVERELAGEVEAPAGDTAAIWRRMAVEIGIITPPAKTWRSAEPKIRYTTIINDLIATANRALEQIPADHEYLSRTATLRRRVFIIAMDEVFFTPHYGNHLYGIAATIARAVLQDPGVSTQTVRNVLRQHGF